MRTLAVACCLAASACYSGVHVDAVGILDENADSAGGDSSGEGPGGDSGDPDSGDSPQAQCADPQVGDQPLRRLTRVQYTNSVRDLIGIDTDVAEGFPVDERIGAFESNAVAPISNLAVEQYMDAAETLAVEALALQRDALLPCDPALDGEDACAETFVRTFGARAHRRPLTEEDVAMYLSLYDSGQAEDGFDGGIRLVLQGMLQSPYFLYHVEIGGQSDAPNDAETIVAVSEHELASRLSFYLWGSMPDEALFAAADAGTLADPEELRAQAERMLAHPRAAETIASFHEQWLHVDDMTAVDKDPVVFPEFDEALKGAMQREVGDFASYVIREGDANLRTLLTGSFTVSDDPALLELYGVEAPVGHVSGEPIELDPTERAGLLTQPALLAKAAHVEQSSPVHRGVVVRQNFLCQMLPAPPDDVDDTPPDPDPDATTRERFHEHTADPACAGCHVLIDGLGFGFENYDAIGSWRTDEGGLPIDASGEIVGTSNADQTFDGAVELAGILAGSPDVQRCVSEQWFSYALGRVAGDEDACSTDAIYEAFAASDLDVRSLIIAVVTSDAFRYRRLEGGM